MLRVLSHVPGVFKFRIGVFITLCAVAGLAITPGAAPPPWKVAVLALAVFLSSASAGAFNQYQERDLDALMARTRNRPFVTGLFRPGWFWLAIIGLTLAVAVAAAGLTLNAHVAAYIFLGAFSYGIVYTVWLKRRTAWNIVVGGLAGSFAVLAGAAAVSSDLAPEALVLAIVLFLWTPPHFWSLAIALHRDYAAAGVPMLPVVIGDRATAWVILAHAVALAGVSFLPVAYGMGAAYLLGAIAGGAFFIWRSIQLVRAPGRRAAWLNFQASFVQLALLLTGVIVDAALKSSGAIG